MVETDLAPPVAAIVRRLGGQAAVGRLLGLNQSTVWEWVSKGRTPSRRIPQIIAAAARLDPPVHLRPDDFFDLSTGSAGSVSGSVAAVPAAPSL